MTYRLLLTDRAFEQLEAACRWYEQNAPHVAARWFNGFVDSLDALRNNPERYGLARESAEFPFELRELLYGVGRRRTHRALFAIRPQSVVVFAIRHVSQQDITPDDLTG